MEYKTIKLNGRKFSYIDDNSKLYCPYCHQRVDEDSSSCWNCGKSFMDTEFEKEQAFKNYRENSKNSNYVSYKPKAAGTDIASMILGICSLVFLFFYGLVALVCAFVSLCLGSNDNSFGKAGRIMSWITIIIFIVRLILIVSACGLVVGTNSW